MSLKPKSKTSKKRTIILSASKIRREQKEKVRQSLETSLKEAEEEYKNWTQQASKFESDRNKQSKKLAKICRKNASGWYRVINWRRDDLKKIGE